MHYDRFYLILIMIFQFKQVPGIAKIYQLLCS